MPTIILDKEDLFNALNCNYTTREFEELCFDFGLELEEDTSELEIVNEISKRPQLKIDVPANRYDLLCFEGISRALNIFLGHQKAPQFKLFKPEKMQILNVSKETAEIRPFISAAILKGLNFTKNRYESFISLQEKLHLSICRNRSLASIGTHDLDTIQGPFSYEAHKPEDVNFIPLNQKKSMNMVELFEFYKDDKHIGKFLHLIKESPIYPVLYDSNRTVCSLPPIINSEHSKITLNTKNVLIEVTATDQTKLEIVTNIMIAMFSCYSEEPFTIEPVQVISPHNQCSRIWPKIDPYIKSVEISYINSCCGLNLSAEEISKLLEKMGFSSKQSTSLELLDIFVPITRPDILHQCDIMEEVAVAYGYNLLKKPFTNKVSTIGKPLPLNKLTDVLRKECSMAGWSEVMPLILCSHDENFKYLGKTDDSLSVTLANPKSSDYQIIRTSLIPGLLKTIRENKKHPLPIKIFEISDIVLKNNDEETLCKNKRLWSAAYFSNTSGFEIIHGLLDKIMNMLSTNKVTPESKDPGYWIQNAEDSIFLKGRCAKVFLRLKNMLEINIGTFGILHPNVLKAFEIPFVGAQVLAWSIKDSKSKKHLSALVTKKTLSESTLIALNEIYDELINVEHIYSQDIDKLNLFYRPDLNASLTKIHIWAQEKFKKIVYLDADAFCLKNIDELFDLDTNFAAIPDISWPDIFNSGVFVTKPNNIVYNSLINLAKNNISFDEFNIGGDQGLLNSYFSKWHRLPFIYNVVPSFSYQYLPAYNKFKSEISVVHFAGMKKPWILDKHSTNYKPYDELIDKWQSILKKHTTDQNFKKILSSENKSFTEKNIYISDQASEESHKEKVSYKPVIHETFDLNKVKSGHKQSKKQNMSSILSEATIFDNINYENEWNKPFDPKESSFKPQSPLPMPENIKKEMEKYNIHKNVVETKKISPFSWNERSKTTRVFLNEEPSKEEIDISKYQVKITSKNVFLYYKTKETADS
ncbi:hypothetical protein PORY_000091 [Pneumocystis oryctolagi]|uniref:Uncharacterized protein n=1 Tax=Pneumocystis oryctolagi TaxID=42067 RepID=A0ACB7CES9_9ASCO|nr:hypothetical protein PORY_000091 [Pneumocystis oryctolagi]